MSIKSLSFLCFLFVSLTAQADMKTRPFEIPHSDTVSVKDANTSRVYNLHIQLPIDYSSTKKYPVVYMTDAWYTFPVVAGSIKVPVDSGRMHSVILVGISEEVGLSVEASRLRDYTPTKNSTWSMHSGESATHLDYIRRYVIPYIETNYSADSTQRTYVGMSLGGLFGAYILMSQPDTFRNYILASPSLWYDDELLLEMEEKYAAKNTDLNANVYISVGARETPEHKETINNMVKFADNFYSVLKQRNYKNLNLEFKTVDSANHEISFPTSAIQGLYWLFKK